MTRTWMGLTWALKSGKLTREKVLKVDLLANYIHEISMFMFFATMHYTITEILSTFPEYPQKFRFMRIFMENSVENVAVHGNCCINFIFSV